MATRHQYFVLSTCLRGWENNLVIHLPTKVCNTYLLQSWEPVCLILESVPFTLALRTFYILRRGWKQLNVPENWTHKISTYPVTAIVTQNGNSKCFREQTIPVQGKWVHRLYHCCSARKMNKFAPWVEAKEQNSWALPKITWVCLARLMLFHGDSQALLCLAVWCLAASCTVRAVQKANKGPGAYFFFLQESSCLRDNSRKLQARSRQNQQVFRVIGK